MFFMWTIQNVVPTALRYTGNHFATKAAPRWGLGFAIFQIGSSMGFQMMSIIFQSSIIFLYLTLQESRESPWVWFSLDKIYAGATPGVTAWWPSLYLINLNDSVCFAIVLPALSRYLSLREFEKKRKSPGLVYVNASFLECNARGDNTVSALVASCPISIKQSATTTIEVT